MTSITIISKAQFNSRNTFFKSVSGKLQTYAIECALYNYTQVLNGNYASFGITHIAMSEYNAVRKAYAGKIAKLARSFGVVFAKDTGKTSKANKADVKLVTIEEFNTLLIDALDKKSSTETAYTLDNARKAFDSVLKRADEHLTIDEVTSFLEGIQTLCADNLIEIKREREQNASEQETIESVNAMNAMPMEVSLPAVEAA